MVKVANFFTFPKYENGRLGTTFCSQITFSVVGRGLKWSKLPQFHKGGHCREQQEGEMTNQKRCLVIHVAHNFWVIFLLKHLSLGDIWGWEPFFGKWPEMWWNTQYMGNLEGESSIYNWKSNKLAKLRCGSRVHITYVSICDLCFYCNLQGRIRSKLVHFFKHCQRHNGPRNWLRDLD